MKTVGLIGQARSGKSTSAQFIKESGDYVEITFAEPVKQMLRVICDLDAYEDRRDEPIPPLGKSYRELCTTLGTEWGRKMIDENIWVKLAEAKADEVPSPVGVIFSDVRYENEADLVIERGGSLIQITKPGLAQINHDSEKTKWDSYPIQVVGNTGTLPQLRNNVLKAVKGSEFIKFIEEVKSFSGEEDPYVCTCKHQLQNTGGVFYQSVELLQCSNCSGWQKVRKPVK